MSTFRIFTTKMSQSRFNFMLECMQSIYADTNLCWVYFYSPKRELPFQGLTGRPPGAFIFVIRQLKLCKKNVHIESFVVYRATFLRVHVLEKARKVFLEISFTQTTDLSFQVMDSPGGRLGPPGRSRPTRSRSTGTTFTQAVF